MSAHKASAPSSMLGLWQQGESMTVIFCYRREYKEQDNSK